MNALESDGEQEEYSNLIFGVLGIGLLYAVCVARSRRYPNLDHIPVSGHRQCGLSFLDALRYLTDCQQSLKKGYKSFYPRIFKVSTLQGWKVILTGSHHIEELRKAPEDVISLSDAVGDPRTLDYLSGHCHDQMSPGVVAKWTQYLTQNMSSLLPAMREEVVASLHDMPLNVTQAMGEAKSNAPSDADWRRIKATDLIEEVVTRAVNRAFLGSTVSHDTCYSSMTRTALHDAPAFSITRFAANLLPKTPKFLGSIFSPSTYRRWRMKRHLRGLIADHQISEKRSTEKEPLKVDLLSRLLEDEPLHLLDDGTTSLLIEYSLKSMQMISTILLQVLCRLAASSDTHIAEIRDEIENTVLKEGWSGSHTLESFHKLDSLIKETMRVSGLSPLSTMRKTVAPFTFQDGTGLPPQTLVFSNAYARHHDATIYPAPGTFDAFRFSEMHEEHCKFYGDDSGGARFNLETASPSFLAWGHGRHACPGRFFASAVMKLILAEIIVLLDIRFEDGAPRRDDFWLGDILVSNRDVEILVRARSR